MQIEDQVSSWHANETIRKTATPKEDQSYFICKQSRSLLEERSLEIWMKSIVNDWNHYELVIIQQLIIYDNDSWWESRERRRIVIPVSHSGVAVNLLPNGCTAHRKFGIPIEVSDVRKFQISPDSAEGKFLYETSRLKQILLFSEIALASVDYVIWEEISMCDKRRIV
ncbi:hypothetical protein CRE_06309 [Caenorhabditis remanei]|uniref:ATP-dependent DNA helicase n=1 Tax=Caenorhabditis remanei TaxID=31234 RepID=E3M175_CAERE|nr:hypothetical protein CRE_06309 [Caenorhabditis remanei]